MDTRRPDDDAADRPARANESDGAATLFDRLYAEHVAFVFRTLRQLGVPESTLEDAVQNVFIVVHRKLGEFEGRASLRTWLFRIVRRVASDARRSMRRRGGTEPIDEAMVDDGARLPDGEAERNEAARRLAQILETLDDEKRAVFVLAEIESMSAPEIAEALGVNVNTVASRLRAARQAFERALERDRRRNG
jgi:RNA polymerase sigma-70 factor (ECF subfamily)